MIQTIEDGKTQKNAIPFDPKKTTTTLEFEGVTIMEGGMQSGATSLAFKLVDKNGNQYWAEMSALLLQTLTSTLNGAEERFQDDKAGS